MVIIHQIRSAIGWIVAETLLVGAGCLLAVIAPAVLFALPLVLLVLNPRGDYRDLAQLFVFLTPVSVMFYMGVMCHYHSLLLWKLQGKDLGSGSANWREAQGGWVRTLSKSFGFMALGLFGSFACELLFEFGFQFANVSGTARHALWFALFPFAAFAPVILLLWKRRNYAEKQRYPQQGWSERRRLASSELYTDAELEAEEAEMRAKRDAKFLKELGVSPA